GSRKPPGALTCRGPNATTYRLFRRSLAARTAFVSRARGASLIRSHRDSGGLPHMPGSKSVLKRLPLLVLSLVFFAGSARAQVAGHPIEGSGGLGFAQFDSRDHIRAAGLATGSLGYRWSTGLTYEAGWLGSITKRDELLDRTKHRWSWVGVDLRWSLRDPS